MWEAALAAKNDVLKSEGNPFGAEPLPTSPTATADMWEAV